ncbi:hypothetical protein [Streptomyces ossamyceticus]|jgi:Trk K+ transport system NAD-binding subunit|uniref:hypothetical protein n=1 Tax=Streptomyces ossamyceticus TaxID=249581 RepID=UPI0006E3A4AA|nr:hypothetical protein [Streptomyces ossamyceticus]
MVLLDDSFASIATAVRLGRAVYQNMGTVVATIVRDGQPTVPDPAIRLRAGDELLLVSRSATEQEIHAAFQ